MQKIELHQAWAWDCEQCGAENFCRCVTADLSDDDAEELFRRFHDMEDYEELPAGWSDFQMVTSPNEVTCRECGANFETVDQRINDH